MTSFLRILEELADAPDHAARARWLLEAPLSVLMRDQVTVNRLLSAAGFHDGLAYFGCRDCAAFDDARLGRACAERNSHDAGIRPHRNSGNCARRALTQVLGCGEDAVCGTLHAARHLARGGL